MHACLWCEFPDINLTETILPVDNKDVLHFVLKEGFSGKCRVIWEQMGVIIENN